MPAEADKHHAGLRQMCAQLTGHIVKITCTPADRQAQEGMGESLLQVSEAEGPPGKLYCVCSAASNTLRPVSKWVPAAHQNWHFHIQMFWAQVHAASADIKGLCRGGPCCGGTHQIKQQLTGPKLFREEGESTLHGRVMFF